MGPLPREGVVETRRDRWVSVRRGGTGPIPWWRRGATRRRADLRLADLGGTHVARALEARVRGYARRMGVLVTRHHALAETVALLVCPGPSGTMPAAGHA